MKDREDSTVGDTVLHAVRSNYVDIESHSVPDHRIHSEALTNLLNERQSLSNARYLRESSEYMLNIMVDVKDADFQNVFNQLTVFYKDIDAGLKQRLLLVQ